MRIQLVSDQDTLTLTDDRLDRMGDAWIRKDGVDGLYGATKPRETGQAIPQQDGSYWPIRLTAESRTVTIRCVTSTQSTLALSVLVDRINAMACRPLTLVVDDTSGRRELSGWLADDPAQSMLASLRSMTFSLIIYCPDPLKYGPRIWFEATHALARVENAGNAPTWPSVRAEGSQTLTLTLDGHTVRWRGDGGRLDLDFTDMVPSQGVIEYDDAFRIPPGISDISVQAQNGGQVGVSLRPAWR